MVIQPMTTETVGQVAAMEAACFADPWSLDALVAELLNPLAVYLVARDSAGRVLGYAGMHRVLDEGHITNVAVHPAWRRRGVGQALVEALIARCRAQGGAFLTLEVRSSNAGAIALYEGLGFARVGLRKNYYRHPAEDALLMTVFLEEAPCEHSGN